jgi:hypothetical protein
VGRAVALDGDRWAMGPIGHRAGVAGNLKFPIEKAPSDDVVYSPRGTGAGQIGASARPAGRQPLTPSRTPNPIRKTPAPRFWKSTTRGC